MMLDESETHTTFELLPDELRMHIASYLDTPSLCFFAATSRRSLGNALAELQKRQRRMLALIHLCVNKKDSIFCYTSHNLYACGNNRYGQLGLSYNKNYRLLTRVKNVPGTILQVVAGYRHTIVLTDQGLYTCGYNGYCQLGLGRLYDNCDELTQVENMSGTILQVVAGYHHTLVLTDQGLYACGRNDSGQLGLSHNKIYNQLTRVENVPGTILQMVAGEEHTLVLTDHGLYACGGKVSGSQLGLSHNKIYNQLTRIENVPGTILQVVAGQRHILVLTDQGLYACGNNLYGQLGLGHTNDCDQLTRVENAPGTILQVMAGSLHTFALTNQGLYACGNNRYGQLGLGHSKSCYQLTRVENIPSIIMQMVASLYHTLLLTNHGLYACGRNDFGQLGLGDKNNRSTFTPISPLPFELKQWSSHLRNITNLIAISTSDAARERDKPDAFPDSAKCARRL